MAQRISLPSRRGSGCRFPVGACRFRARLGRDWEETVAKPRPESEAHCVSIRSIDELIGEIRGLANGRMDRKKSEQMVQEVRAHLDESLRARLEFIADRAVAERETVAAFGDPQEFVDKMAAKEQASRREWFDRRVWRALAWT